MHVRVATTYIVVAAVLLLVLQYGPWRPDRWRGLALALLVLLPLQALDRRVPVAQPAAVVGRARPRLGGRRGLDRLRLAGHPRGRATTG